MTPLEAALLVIIVAILLFVIYYYWKGTKGDISLARPAESRVDEYLDRRFELMIDEWALISRARLESFKKSKEGTLTASEQKMDSLWEFRKNMEVNLNQLEERLNALEKQTGQK